MSDTKKQTVSKNQKTTRKAEVKKTKLSLKKTLKTDRKSLKKNNIKNLKESADNFTEWKNPLETIDWKHSGLSLILGILVVLIIVGVLISAAKGKTPSVNTDKLTPISSSKIHTQLKKANDTPTVTIGSNQPIAGSTYTVHEGDQLADIAQRAYGNPDRWVDIAQANGITDPNQILVGQTLQIPR